MQARRSHSWTACTPLPCLLQQHSLHRHRLLLYTAVLCSQHLCQQAHGVLPAHDGSHTLLELGIHCVGLGHTGQHPRQSLEREGGLCQDLAAQSLPPCAQTAGHAAQARPALWHGGEQAHAVCAWRPQDLGASRMLQDGLPLNAMMTYECEGSASCHGQSVLVCPIFVAWARRMTE